MAPRPKVPKTVKLPWGNSYLALARADRVVVTGDLGAIALISPEWKAMPWPRLDGFVTALAASDTQLAVGVTGHDTLQAPHVELRDLATGEVSARLAKQADGNVVNLRWSPSQTRLVGVVSPTVTKEHATLVLFDAAGGKDVAVSLGAFTLLAAEFIDDARVLVYGSRENEAFVIDSKTGKVLERRPSEHDLVASITRLPERGFLLSTMWNGWSIVDPNGTVIASGPGTKLCVLEDGVLSARGKELVTCDFLGAVKKKVKAKKTVDALAVARGRLFVLQAGQVEVAEL